jgi:hypothetical protein
MIKKSSKTRRRNKAVKTPSMAREVLSVRLTGEERGVLQREAKSCGASLAGFVRTLVMNHVRQPKERFVSLNETNTHTATGAVSVRAEGAMADMTGSPRTGVAS